MSLVITYQRFWQRRDTTANWESVNPILHSGEFGVEIIEDSSGPTGELKLKLGNGTDAWNTLGYFVPATTDDLPEGLTNLYYTAERAEQDIANLLDPGQGIALAYSPSNGSLTISVDAVAAEIPYDNTASGLSATDVQDAIDEISAGGGGGSGYPEGSSFPGSPSTNDKFYRIDRNVLYYYDGTRWLSTQVYEMGMGGVTTLGATTTNGTRAQWPVRSDYGIYLERWNITTLVATTNNGSNFWTISLNWDTAAASPTTLASFSTGTTPDTPTNWVPHDQNIGAVLNANARVLYITVTRSGTGGALHTPTTLLYRLIG